MTVSDPTAKEVVERLRACAIVVSKLGRMTIQDAITLIEAQAAEIARVKTELAEAHSRQRWNIEDDGCLVRVCQGDHDKSADCEFDTYVPEARATTAESALASERETVKALREALEPFDDALGEDDEGYGDALTVVMKWGACTDYSVTLGDLRELRRAGRRALQGDKP